KQAGCPSACAQLRYAWLEVCVPWRAVMCCVRTLVNRHGAPTNGTPPSLSSFQKEDFSKKSLTLKAQIWYTGGWFQKRRRILPGRFFVFLEPVNKKPKQNMDREKRKTHLMYSLIRLKTLASCVLVCFAFLPQMHAAPNALPTPFPGTNPDGCYPGFTTAEG